MTDSDEGSRNIARAPSDGPIVVILDWFHLAMRLRPLEQIAQGLRTRVRTHANAKSKIVDALEHLHWRLWHGKLDTVAECFEQVKVAIIAFGRYSKGRLMSKGPRALMTGLHELKQYINNNTGTRLNYHRRQQAGLRVSNCGAESTVNVLVNHRMNKRQRMRWSRRGAHLLLQVRAAVLNGEFDVLERSTSVSRTVESHGAVSLPLAAWPPGFKQSRAKTLFLFNNRVLAKIVSAPSKRLDWGVPFRILSTATLRFVSYRVRPWQKEDGPNDPSTT